MQLNLKFATNIVRPWEKLNYELINQTSIDSNISDFITMAEDLAVRISHFPELAGKKSVRTDKKSDEYNIIVDIADATKHNLLKYEDRNNKLSISSVFEGKDNGTFRFIRNKIIVDHAKYGKVDFLEVSKKAAEFVISQIGINLFWKATISEAPVKFINKVSLDIFYKHQFSWNGLQIEFVKKDSNGNLIHYDPPKFLFELRSNEGIFAKGFKDYIYQLIKISLDPDFDILENTDKSINIDFKLVDKKEAKMSAIVIVPENKISTVENFKTFLEKIDFERIIIVCQSIIPIAVKEYISDQKNVFAINVHDQNALNIPIGFFAIKINQSNLRITSIHKTGIGVLQENAELFSNIGKTPVSDLGKIFSLDKVNLIDFKELCLSQVKVKNGKTKGRLTITYEPRDKKKDFFIMIENQFIKIGIELDLEWETDIVELKSSILTFVESKMGMSLWNVETFLSGQNGKFQIKIPALKFGNTTAFGML